MKMFAPVSFRRLLAGFAVSVLFVLPLTAKKKAAPDSVLNATLQVAQPELVNISDKESAAAADQIRDRLIANLREYTPFRAVVDITNEKHVLEQQRKSEGIMRDQDMAIELGKIATAGLDLSSSVRLLSGVYVMNIKLTDLTTAQVRVAATSEGCSSLSEIFWGQGCAVDELTIKLCNQLGIPLDDKQIAKLSLPKGASPRKAVPVETESTVAVVKPQPAPVAKPAPKSQPVVTAKPAPAATTPVKETASDIYIKAESAYSRKEYANAFTNYKKAADMGEKRAYYGLARAFHYGQGTEKNLLEAILHYEKSAESGDSLAQGELARLYYGWDESPVKDYKKAFFWAEKAAAQKDGNGQYMLAFLYFSGAENAVECDWVKAAENFELYAAQKHASEKGKGIAYDAIGLMYEQGRYGLTSDLTKALGYYEKAAELGNENAQKSIERIKKSLEMRKALQEKKPGFFARIGDFFMNHPVILAISSLILAVVIIVAVAAVLYIVFN